MYNEWKAQQIEWEPELNDIVNFYLDDLEETALVCEQTWEQGQRVYEAAETEVSVLEVLSRVAAEQCERLLPRPEGQPPRVAPQAADLFRHLERVQFERTLARVRDRIAVATGQAREQGLDIGDELARLTVLQEQMINDFYNRRWPLGDDEEAGGAIGVLAKIGPPMRGPGGGRTFEEALDPPRNP